MKPFQLGICVLLTAVLSGCAPGMSGWIDRATSVVDLMDKLVTESAQGDIAATDRLLKLLDEISILDKEMDSKMSDWMDEIRKLDPEADNRLREKWQNFGKRYESTLIKAAGKGLMDERVKARLKTIQLFSI